MLPGHSGAMRSIEPGIPGVLRTIPIEAARRMIA